MEDNKNKKLKAYEIIWERDFTDGAGNMGIAVDSDDNAIVCGINQNEDKGIVVKYDKNGEEQWSDADLPEVCNFSSTSKMAAQNIPAKIREILTREYGYFFDVAVDSENNIIVAGTFTRDGGTKSMVYIKKYDPSGNTIWTKTHEPFTVNIASGITVDSNDDIFVVGGGTMAPLSFKGFVIKISKLNGMILWRKIRRKGIIALYTGATVDAYNDVLASGFTSYGNDLDLMITKFGGKRGWKKREFIQKGNKAPIRITIDEQGNFVVAGKTEDSTEMHYLLKLDYSFNILWETSQKTKGFLYGAAIMENGDIAVTGHRESVNEYYAALYGKNTGDKIMDMLLGERVSNLIDDYMRGIAVDHNNDLLITGARTISKTMKVRITSAVEHPAPELPVPPSVFQPQAGKKESILQKILRWVFGR